MSFTKQTGGLTVTSEEAQLLKELVHQFKELISQLKALNQKTETTHKFLFRILDELQKKKVMKDDLHSDRDDQSGHSK